MNACELSQSFQASMRYKRAVPWRKPFVEPRRFLVNQLRKFGVLRPPTGTLREVPAFHASDFAIVVGEGVGNEIASYGVFEDQLTEAFLRLVQPNQVVVDIGMHLGYFTVLFAQLVGNGGQVHSFEPTPSTRTLGLRNVGRFPQVTVHPYAVWSSQQTMTFNDYGQQLMGFNSFTRARLDTGIKGTPFQVETTTLDHLRRSLARPIAVVKIDAESAEKEILIGAEELLRLDRPILSVEVGDIGQETTSRELVEWLAAANYVPWESTLSGFRPHIPKERYSYDNLIFAPAGSDITKIQAA
jgi:FkbM family methyltransferase